MLAHYSIMFDECCKFMFLLRQYIYHVLREFLCLYELLIILFSMLSYCKPMRLTLCINKSMMMMMMMMMIIIIIIIIIIIMLLLLHALSIHLAWFM